MESEYGKPGAPAVYGPGRQMTGEEKAFLEGVQAARWRPMAPDRFGRVGLYPDGQVTREDLQRITSIITECRLPTRVGSGMFGLSGYSMTVYDSPEPVSMIVEKPPALLTLMDDHMPWGQEEKGTDHQVTWEFFTSFVYSEDNLLFLDYYGLERPRDRAEYDY